MFAMQERLDAAIQALKVGSWDGGYSGDFEEKTLELLHKLVSLSGVGRNALCDMLLRLQANDALTVGELRANLKTYAKLLVGPH